MPAVIPLAALLAFQGGANGGLMATMIVVYGVAMVAVARNVHSAVIDALTLRSENQALVFQREEHTRMVEDAIASSICVFPSAPPSSAPMAGASGLQPILAAKLSPKTISPRSANKPPTPCAKPCISMPSPSTSCCPTRRRSVSAASTPPGTTGSHFSDVTNGLLAPLKGAPHPQSSLCLRVFDRASALSTESPSGKPARRSAVRVARRKQLPLRAPLR